MQTNASGDPSGTRRMLAKLVAAVRGDKYMAGAYDDDAAPSAGQPAAAPPTAGANRGPAATEDRPTPPVRPVIDEGWL